MTKQEAKDELVSLRKEQDSWGAKIDLSGYHPNPRARVFGTVTPSDAQMSYNTTRIMVCLGVLNEDR